MNKRLDKKQAKLCNRLYKCNIIKINRFRNHENNFKKKTI